jgi:hypothetical protein
MQSVTNDNFGLLIAYAIPGLIVIAGVGYLSPTVAGWLGAVPANAPTVGGFLYVTVASIAAGMFVSAVRWLVIDTIHHRTGLPPPAWDFGQLREQMSPFLTFVEHNYRYYQFYSGTLVSLVFVYAVRRVVLPTTATGLLADTMILLLLGALCFVGSRDALRRYYERVNQLQRSGPPVRAGATRRP